MKIIATFLLTVGFTAAIIAGFIRLLPDVNPWLIGVGVCVTAVQILALAGGKFWQR